MKCLSLWQPWADLLVRGCKTIETRSWPTLHRGPLLIHAAGKMDDANMRLLDTHPDFRKAFAPYRFKAWHDAYGELPFGAIIGVVNVTDCLAFRAHDMRSGDRRIPYPGFPEVSFGNFAFGRFGFVCSDPCQFEHPVEYRGRQRLFDVPDHVVAAQLAAAGWRPA